MTDLRALLPLHALGVLDPEDAARVEHAVAGDPVLAAELAAHHDSVHALVAAVAPAPAVHARLLASIGAGRFEKFAARMAQLFDVTVDRARELLGLIERPGSWETPIPGLGLQLVHFAGGPASAAADCGFVRLAPGSAFPFHAHLGEEVSLILAGTLQDQSGALLHPGDELVQTEAHEHAVTCVGETDCLYAARATNGIAISGAPMRPRKP